MKKLLNLKCLFVLLFAAFTNSAFAVTDPPTPTLGAIENEKGFQPAGSGLYNFYPNDCETTTVTFKVSLANLVLANGEAELPSGYPAMFLKYTISGITETVQLTSFNENEAETYWLSEVESLPFDVTLQCSDQDNGQYFTMPFTLELLEPIYGVTPEGVIIIVGYQPYPACQYAMIGEVFSCTFHNNGCCATSVGCPRGEEVCVADQMIFAEDELRIYCDECGPVSKGQQNNDENDSSENLTPYLVANPNPFNDYVEVYWSDNTQIEEIELYDINGKRHQSWGKSEVKNTNRLSINADDLAKGVYFIKVQLEDSMEILKVIKQ